MAYSTPVQEAIDRLSAYNASRYDASTNPLGFAGTGYLTNIPQAYNDMALVGTAIDEKAAQVDADKTTTTANASSAGTSASNAAASATLAQKWANEDSGVEVAGGEYSALHYAIVSQQWANAAEDFEIVAGLFSSLHYAAKSEEWSLLSQAWATGTLPGGAGTKSAREYSEEAALLVASANLPTIQSGDASKVLTVKADETGYELTTVQTSAGGGGVAESIMFV